MQEFLKRVEEVNRDDFYPYRVSKLVLFGSYLNPEQMDLGDIDIAFELEPKIKDYDELEETLASFLKEGRDSDEEDEKPKKKKKGIHKDHYMDDDEPKKKKRKYKSDI